MSPTKKSNKCTSSSKVTTIIRTERYFNCIECLTPSTTLYRQISSSPSSIKLTKCMACRKDVDPYIEREWILVFLDILLLRLSANRHFYLHRTRRRGTIWRIMFSSSSSVSPNTTYYDDDNYSLSLLSLHNSYFSWIFYTCLIILLDAYLKYQANGLIINNSHLIPISFLLSSSLLEHWVQVASIFILSSIVILPRMVKAPQQKYRQNNRKLIAEGGLYHKLFNGLSLPAIYMKILVSSILIWENTNIVRGLGALLIRCQQYLSFFCIIQHEIVTMIFMDWIKEQQQQQASSYSNSIITQEKCESLENKNNNTEDISYWVNLFLIKNSSTADTSFLQTCLQRTFLLNNTGVLMAMSLFSIGASVMLQSLVSLSISRLSPCPLLCSGFYVSLSRKSGTNFSLCVG